MVNYKKAMQWTKQHLVDATGLAVVFNPVFAVLETFVSRMPDATSLNARILGTIFAYAGFAAAYSRGMDFSRKHFKVTEKGKKIHDTLYGMSFNLMFGPAFYFAAGARDLKEIAAGTAAGILFGLISGGPVGYSIDAYRDFTGIKESVRLPNIVKNLSKNYKRLLAATIFAASLGSPLAVYKLTPDKSLSWDKPKVVSIDSKVTEQTSKDISQTLD